MQKMISRGALMLFISGALLFALTLSAHQYPAFLGLAPTAGNADQVGSAPTAKQQGLPDFVGLAKRLSPVVVNISTTQAGGGRPTMPPSPFGEEDPFSEFWRRFFGDPFRQRPFRQKSLGSGFIIDRQGFILTNHHVVADADKIVVRLSDETEFEAKVIGSDPKTDIAVIKIEAGKDLPAAPLGDSDRLEVGEWVLAIGNPFGLDRSVTAGIVSAKDRLIGVGPYDAFIQTDASINPGNSGGPLINLQGEVVGINTAIFSRTGGNIGIGFATPINLVKSLLPQLKSKGKVTRGWLGVVIQNVDPTIAESLGMKEARGALVANVANDSPAERAGVKAGDVIIEFGGTEIRTSNDLPILVARTPVGETVPLKVWRDNREVALSVTIGELTEEEADVVAGKVSRLGLTVQAVTPEIAESLGLEQPQGVVVSAVERGSSAGEAGLRRGDVILEVNRKAIRTLADYRQALEEAPKDKGILLFVRRGERTFFRALKPEK